MHEKVNTLHEKLCRNIYIRWTNGNAEKILLPRYLFAVLFQTSHTKNLLFESIIEIELDCRTVFSQLEAWIYYVILIFNQSVDKKSAQKPYMRAFA